MTDSLSKEGQVKVSVYMPAYCQENDIGRAIESVMNQQTTFPFELLIVDDCSTDGTRNIILEYEKKHPNIIRVVLNDHNLGLSNNFHKAKCLCKGTYITSIAGDDYYIDMQKLQKQADFLDNHDGFLAAAIVLEGRYDNDTVGFMRYPKPRFRNAEFTLEQFLAGNDFPLNGIMMRNVFLTDAGRAYYETMPKMSPYIDDLTDCILTLKLGRVFVLDECTSVYRVQKKTKSATNFNATNRGLLGINRHIALLNNLYKYYDGQLNLQNRYGIIIADGVLYALLAHNLKAIKDIYQSIPAGYRAPWYRGVFLKSVPFVLRRILTVINKSLFHS